MSSVFYTYGNSTWGDQLTAYDGTTISYDASGNPLNWRNVESLSWTGRELTYLYNDSGYNGMYFRYNADGIRTYKSHYDHNTLDMYHVNYVLDGTKIVSEYYTHEINNATYTIKYYYDANDSVIGFNYNGTDYYYRKNLQGDIIAILNTSGSKVVEYTYNAWGEVLSVTGSLASTVGQINPFRYRGYYYDTETGFYYLQSRYYDPVVGRFLNADNELFGSIFSGVMGNNYYTYAGNNPVNNTDRYGYFIIRRWMISTPIDIILSFIPAIGAAFAPVKAIARQYGKSVLKSKLSTPLASLIRTIANGARSLISGFQTIVSKIPFVGSWLAKKSPLINWYKV